MAEDKKTQAPELDPVAAATIAAILQAMGGSSANNKASTTTSKDVIKLTPAAAKALLQSAADDAQFTGKFSTADINKFIEDFTKEANKQIETVVRTAKENTTPGATEADIQKSIQNLVTTTYPSFFKPAEFAKNYVWSKVNFGEASTLGGKAVTALQSARQAVKDFNLLGVSDAEIQVAAKQIAMGKKSLEDYKAELSQKAIIEYPSLAERFKANPGLTTKDIASPVINLLATTWEVDPSTIGLDDELVQGYLRPGGADGKTPPLSIAEIKRKALSSPKFETTTKANELARESATSWARALGAGV